MNYAYETKEECDIDKKTLKNRIKINNIHYKFEPIFDLFEAKQKLIYASDNLELKNKKYHTFEYILNNHEAGGIYIEIKNGKLNKLILLINKKFKNHWNKFIKPINAYKYNLNKEKILKSKGNYINNFSKLKKIENWTKNGNLINMFEYFGDKKYFNSYQFELIDMINETLKHKKIINTEFIIWCKDVPLMSVSGIDMFFPKYKWQHKTNKYLPIFSQSTINNYYDIPIPNADEWRMISKKYIPNNCDYDDIKQIIKVKWEDKIEKGFFV